MHMSALREEGIDFIFYGGCAMSCPPRYHAPPAARSPRSILGVSANLVLAPLRYHAPPAKRGALSATYATGGYVNLGEDSKSTSFLPVAPTLLPFGIDAVPHGVLRLAWGNSSCVSAAGTGTASSAAPGSAALRVFRLPLYTPTPAVEARMYFLPPRPPRLSRGTIHGSTMTENTGMRRMVDARGHFLMDGDGKVRRVGAA